MVQIAPAGTPLARTSLAKTRTSTHRRVELTPWQKAVQGRETLEAISAGSRTRADYTRAMNGFREIYHQNPADTYAPPAINAVAELLAEQGRGLHDSKSLKDAIGQYEFLIKEYPTSSLRVAAVLAQAQIYENDLHDAPGARERYALLLKLYPKSGQAEEARAGLASLKEKTPGPGSRAQRGQSPVVAKAKSSGTSESAARSAERSSFAPMPVTKRKTVMQSSPPAEAAPVAESSGAKNTAEKKTVAAETPGPAHVAQGPSVKSGRLAQVTGIRHWSTPNYTRVAIDLGDDVTYQAARVPNPDRIYFDRFTPSTGSSAH